MSIGDKREILQDAVYGNRAPVPDTRAAVERETFLSVMHETGSRLGDCLAELGRISAVLLGPTRDDLPPLPSANCMAEEMQALREVSLRIWARLENLAAGMGV